MRAFKMLVAFVLAFTMAVPALPAYAEGGSGGASAGAGSQLAAAAIGDEGLARDGLDHGALVAHGTCGAEGRADLFAEDVSDDVLAAQALFDWHADGTVFVYPEDDADPCAVGPLSWVEHGGSTWTFEAADGSRYGAAYSFASGDVAGFRAFRAEFLKDNSLKALVVEEGVAAIANGAFASGGDYGALERSLRSVELPVQMDYLGSNAFSGDSLLTGVRMPERVALRSWRVFAGTGLAEAALPVVVQGRQVSTLRYSDGRPPQQVWSSPYAGWFDGCKALRSIAVPEGMEELGGYPDDEFLTTYPWAFGTGLSALRSIDLPSTMRHVTSRAFNCYPALSSVRFRSASFPACEGGENLFTEEFLGSVAVYYPEGGSGYEYGWDGAVARVNEWEDVSLVALADGEEPPGQAGAAGLGAQGVSARAPGESDGADGGAPARGRLLAAQAAHTFTLSTSLQDGFVMKGSTKTFRVTARRDGVRINCEAELFRDGFSEPLDMVAKLYSDYADASGETMFLDMSAQPAGSYTLRLHSRRALDGGGWEDGAVSKDYRFTFQKVPEGGYAGTATFSIEAFTLGLGYIEQPTRVPLYNGENAAQVLERFLRDHGYSISGTGSAAIGFYLGRIRGISQDLAGVQIDPTVARALARQDEYVFDPRDYADDGSLGEFDFTDGSGWMYSVNGGFPNVGLSEYVLDDGAVVRLQFTLALGADIGANGATGGNHPDYYAVADATEATEYLGRVNGALNAQAIGEDAGAARRVAALEAALGNLGSSQDEVDEALDALRSYLDKSGEWPEIGLPQTELEMERGQVEQLQLAVAATGSLRPQVIEWQSSDCTVATVDATGKVTAFNGGDAEITARLGARTARCTVRVVHQPLEDFRMRPYSYPWNDGERRFTGNIAKLQQDGSYRLKAGERVVLQVVPEPASATGGLSVALASSDESVAQVMYSDDGWNGDGATAAQRMFDVRAVGKGHATVTATIEGIERSVEVYVDEAGVEGAIIVEDDGPNGLRPETSSVVLWANDHSAAYHAWVGVDVYPEVASVGRDSQSISVDVVDPSLVDATVVRAERPGYMPAVYNFYRLHLTSKGRAGATDVRLRVGTHTSIVHVTVLDAHASYARGGVTATFPSELSRAVAAGSAGTFSVGLGRTAPDSTGGGWNGIYDGRRYDGAIDGIARMDPADGGSEDVTITVDDAAGVLAGAESQEVVMASSQMVSRSYAYAGGGAVGTAWVSMDAVRSGAGAGEPAGGATWSFTVAESVVDVARLAITGPEGVGAGSGAAGSGGTGAAGGSGEAGYGSGSSGSAVLAEGADPWVPNDSGGFSWSPPASGAVSLDCGGQLQLGCIAQGAEEGSSPTAVPVWYSDNPFVATVDARTGLVRGVRGGTATVYACCGGWIASVAVTVEQAAVALSLSREELTLAVGEGAALFAIPEPWSATDEVSWVSDDEAVATVDADGAVRGVGAGTCLVRARTASGLSAKCKVQVALNPLRDAWFDGVPYTMARGDELQLAGDLRFRTLDGREAQPDLADARWWSSDEAIATVDGSGAVTGVSSGTCVIYCAVEGAVARCPLKVGVPMRSIYVVDESGAAVGEDGIEITNGGQVTLEVAPDPADTDELLRASWASSRENCVYVQPLGTGSSSFTRATLVALRPGTSVVTVSMGSFAQALQVRVVRTPEQQAIFEMQQAIASFARDFPDPSALTGDDRAAYVAAADAVQTRWDSLDESLRERVPEYAESFEGELARVDDMRAVLACEELMQAAAAGDASAVEAAKQALSALTPAQRALVSDGASSALAAGEAAVEAAEQASEQAAREKAEKAAREQAAQEQAAREKAEREAAAKAEAEASLANAAVKLSATKLAYSGKGGRVPSVKVTSKSGKALSAGTHYELTFLNAAKAPVKLSAVKSAGAYFARVTAKAGGGYAGSKTVAFTVSKAKNTARAAKKTVKKTLKAKSLAKKAGTIALPKVKRAFGKPTWKVAKKDKKGVLKLKSGKVRVKKGAKKGTYTMKVRAVVRATANWTAAKTKPVTVKVKVR